MNRYHSSIVGGTLLFLTACGDSGAAAESAPADAVEDLNRPLQISVFPGASNWPLWVADEEGFFGRERIQVQVSPTPNSVVQMTGLVRGDIDIAITAIDNVVAYREGQAPVTGPDLVAIMGVDNGFLRLVAAPALHSYDDLRGKTLSVDAPATGFAFVLYELLSRAGLELGTDYTPALAAVTASRYQALMNGEQSATLLTPPYDVQAVSAGYNRIATAIDTLQSYQGLVAGVSQSWARSHRRSVLSYIRAYRNAVHWLYDSRNQTKAVEIFLRNMPGVSADVAGEVYRAFFVDPNGIFLDGTLDVDGTKTVLALRSKYAVPHKDLTDPMPYIDSSFLQASTSP